MIYTVTRLKRRGPRKGETLTRNAQHGRGAALGSMADSDTSAGGASHAVGAGKGLTITRVTGLGRQWVGDKDANAARFAAQARADRRAAARDRLAGVA
jgi:hypothetical protein